MKKDLLVGEVKALESDDPNGAFEVILSAPTLDRDGEVVDAKCFEPLPDHITFDIDHGMSVATTVASGAPRYDGDLLKVTGTFSSIPRAQEVRTLVTEGHIRTTSVAFMGAKREVKDGVPHIVSAELLNGAFVPIPSNREALVVAAKGYREQRAEKSLAGSYEERRDELNGVLRTANPEAWWVYVLATFPDKVVYEIEGRDDTQRYEAAYSVADDGTITLEAGIPVDIIEVVQPAKNAEADDEKTIDTDGEVSTNPAEKAAAPAAADLPADVVKARAAIAAAEAALLLTR